jgi:hypothetical protein
MADAGLGLADTKDGRRGGGTPLRDGRLLLLALGLPLSLPLAVAVEAAVSEKAVATAAAAAKMPAGSMGVNERGSFGVVGVPVLSDVRSEVLRLVL